MLLHTFHSALTKVFRDTVLGTLTCGWAVPLFALDPFSVVSPHAQGTTLSGDIAAQIPLCRVQTTAGTQLNVNLAHQLKPSVPHGKSRWYVAPSLSYLVLNSAGRWTWHTPSGGEITLSNKLDGEVRVVSTGNGNDVISGATAWRYDSSGSLREVSHNGSTITVVASAGRVERYEDALGVALRFTYADGARLRTIAPRGGPTMYFGYGAGDALEAVFDESGRELIRMEYINHLATRALLEGSEATWEWEPAGPEHLQLWPGADRVVCYADGKQVSRRITGAIVDILPTSNAAGLRFNGRTGEIFILPNDG